MIKLTVSSNLSTEFKLLYRISQKLSSSFTLTKCVIRANGMWQIPGDAASPEIPGIPGFDRPLNNLNKTDAPWKCIGCIVQFWISQIQAKIIPQRGWRTCARWTLVTRAVKPRLTNKLPSLAPFIRQLMQNLSSFEHFITFSTTIALSLWWKAQSVDLSPLWRYDNFTTMAAAITFSPAAITAITRDNCHQRGGPCLSQS